MTRVGIAGIGFMGMVHYLSYQKIDDVEVVALCEPDDKRRAGDWRDIKGNFGPPGEQMDLSGVTTYRTYEEMVADESLDIIDITLPPAMHHDAALAALGAGKHAFTEKPLAMKQADCQNMRAAAEAAGKHLLVGHVLPHFPEYAWALREINSGKHGKLLAGSFNRTISDPAWLPTFWSAEKIGGPLLDLHVHDAQFIRLAFGMPNEVIARGRMREGLAEHWHSLMQFEGNDMTVHATSGAIPYAGRSFLHGFEIQLEKALLTFEFSVIGDEGKYSRPPTLLTGDGKIEFPELGDGDPMNAFEAELRHVVEVVANDAPLGALDAQLAQDAIAICELERESLAS
ncbi:Gfo/Idh/MocA family protein [Adhaeretor mobilis]|uniref:Glucose--fructose oxidoreductase n=1 Tax=Adhaeretor mobilis TaxID=1930276 RepID=A0A517N149_9BACT|nr:Gfo/Idh/MocA family oxidoreductase [Adhaeretor mobilis]QDT00854.1 Glucose--fructose oxidoreductase precursor [Adhaeretor mobilis]